MNQPINLFEYESMATQYLSPMALDYYASGAWDEVTLGDNRAAFARYKLRPRMLVDVSQRNLKTEVLGQSVEMPILVAPMAFQCLAHPDGELATAKAAADLGAGMVLSTMSTQSLEDVAQDKKTSTAVVPIICTSRSRFDSSLGTTGRGCRLYGFVPYGRCPGFGLSGARSTQSIYLATGHAVGQFSPYGRFANSQN